MPSTFPTSVRLTIKNQQALEAVMAQTGFSFSELINLAVANYVHVNPDYYAQASARHAFAADMKADEALSLIRGVARALMASNLTLDCDVSLDASAHEALRQSIDEISVDLFGPKIREPDAWSSPSSEAEVPYPKLNTSTDKRPK